MFELYDKIFVVIIGLMIIFLVIVAYIFSVERKIKKLETILKRAKEEK